MKLIINDNNVIINKRKERKKRKNRKRTML